MTSSRIKRELENITKRPSKIVALDLRTMIYLIGLPH